MNPGARNRAGWAAFAAALLMIPEVLLTFRYDGGWQSTPRLLLIIAVLLALRTALAAWAMFGLRSLLREQLEERGLDRLILALVIGSVALAAAAILARLPTLAAHDHWAALGLLAVGLPVGVLSLAFGYRLLRIEADFGGLRQPFAWMHMLAPVCFATVILVPLGLLLLVVALALLGAILVRGEAVQPDFV